MTYSEEQLKSVSRMMAAAYWRGKLTAINHEVEEEPIIEAMIKEAAEQHMEEWEPAARVALG